MKRTWPGLLFAILLVACGPAKGDDDDDGDGGVPDGSTLELSPANAVLDVVNGAAVDQAFTATLIRPDQSTEDVTAGSVFQVDLAGLGSFTGSTFTAFGVQAGVGTVTGSYRGVSATAKVTVNVHEIRVGDGVPAEAPGWFDGATDDPSRAAVIVYPSDTTLVPPNLGDFEVHWTDVGGNDLFEVSLAGENVDLKLYTTGVPSAGNWAAYLPEEWAVLGLSLRGGVATARVRSMNSTANTLAGTSAPITIRLANQEIEGGIYYWAAGSAIGAPVGIYRHDMSRPGQAAEAFFTTAESPQGRCVACHALSRDGTQMAIVYDGGGGSATTVDVATRTPYMPPATYYWHFATYEPEGNRLLTARDGALHLRNPTDGAILSTVPTTVWPTHPDFSPRRDQITYVTTPSNNDIWFTGGNIVRRSFDHTTLAWGAETPVVTGGGNNYYPSFSPDGEWILFNRSSEDAYSDASAELWIVKADASVGPIKLDLPNVTGGLTNSWARWAPFEAHYGTSETPEKFYWLTFSSMRAFGVRMAGGTRPQIWMAPFFPDRATAAMQASAPAFRLPFQELTSNNHIAQWTEEFVPIQ